MAAAALLLRLESDALGVNVGEDGGRMLLLLPCLECDAMRG